MIVSLRVTLLEECRWGYPNPAFYINPHNNPNSDENTDS